MTILAAALLLGPTAQAGGSSVSVTAGPVIQGLRPIAFAPAPTGSKFVVCLEDGSVRIMDAKTKSTVRNLTKHRDAAFAAAWSPDGTLIATGDETARIFIENAVTGQKIREYRTHTKGIQKLSFNSSHQFLISTGKDDQINIYDLSKPAPKEAHKILGKGANFYGATFHPKLPGTLATGTLGPGARFYDSNSGKLLGFLTTEDTQGIFDVSYNPSGSLEATAGKDGDVIVWDATQRKKIVTLKGHQDWVEYVSFSPNGKLLASSSVDKSVKVWNTTTFAKIAEITEQSSVGSPLCFTADGTTLVTVTDAGFIEFNTISPAQPGTPVVEKVTKSKKKSHRRRRH